MAAAPYTPPSAVCKGFQQISMLLWFFLIVGVDAQNRKFEVDILMKFKAMMEPWSPQIATGYWSTWNATDKNPCAWYGVSCTANFTVEKIDFSGWGLEVLTPLGVLSNLTDLSKLDFAVNGFESIPDDIGTLTRLTYLDLTDNHLEGPIPSSLSGCSSLRYIYLQANSLTGEIPDLSGLVNLQVFAVGTNQLSGPFPRWMGQSNSLVHVELMFNNFNGTIPSLSNLTNLLELYLNNNNFTGFEEPVFPDAKKLERLDVKFNQLQGRIPLSLTNLNLKILDLSRNYLLSGEIPTNFSLNMQEGIWFDFSVNQLTGTIPANLLLPSTIPLAAFPGLNLSRNLLTGTIPFDETLQYHYYALDLSYNNLSGPLPSICRNSSTFVTNFWLHNNSLSGDIVDFLAHCYGHMGTLLLANNSFTGDLSRLANISTDSLPTSFTTLTTVVDLSNNNLGMSTTEATPDPMRTMLEFFVLNSSVTTFWIPGNDFSGANMPASLPLPAPALQALDLSNNHLKGEISGAVFNSTWLPALQVLNVSNNEITGSIPAAVVLLPNLRILNVINNSLSGSLPALLPDILYNPSFYAGNGGLCGGPLSSCPHRRGRHRWLLFVIVGGAVIVALGSCLFATWRWRVYSKRHQQDQDLIKTLLEGDSATLMSLRELRKATDNFAETAKIGEGGFGCVYSGKLNDGTRVAIKRSKREGSEKDKSQFLNEVRILSQVNHRHLVKLLGCCMENEIALLVFEFVSNGTLQEHLKGKIGDSPLSWKHRLQIAEQTADALNYLHASATYPIYHRDVKSTNIMLNGDLNAKVTDFGISKLAPLEATHVSTMGIQGTIGYIDPEYYTSCQLTDKSDVYSFGVVLLELISAKASVDLDRGGEEIGLVNFAKLQMESGNLQHLLDPALMETYNDSSSYGKHSILNVGRLAMKCLQLRSKARPSMKEVWKELQNLWLELNGMSKDLGTINEKDEKVQVSPRHPLYYDSSIEMFRLSNQTDGSSESSL